jgi:hypothetical protein
MTEDRWLCGWRVSSEIPLPELLPWTGDDRAPDIRIAWGEIPERLADPVHAGPLYQVGRDGLCRFEIAAVAAYLIHDGCEIIVRPKDDAPAPDIRAFLLGTAFGTLCHQRGVLPLHASCVAIDGEAVAIAGPSGVGKSTMAAALADLGHKALADDVTVVDLSSGVPMVLPSFPRIKLWRDALDALGRSIDGLERGRLRLEKFVVPLGDAFATDPVPLAGIYHLAAEADGHFEDFEPLRGLDAVMKLRGQVYRVEAAGWMGRSAAVAAMSARAAAGIRDHVRFARLLRHDSLLASAERIAAHHRGRR